MKHIISLSLKYIRRQKLRSVLTFLCIMLSVFILCSVAAYSSSLFTTLRNQTIAEDGSWEVNFRDIIGGELDDLAAVADVVDNHTAVSENYIRCHEYISANNKENVGGMEIRFDGKGTGYYRSINISFVSGSRELISADDFYNLGFYAPKNKNGIYLPSRIKDEYGYEIGDTISMSITPFGGEIDRDNEKIKSIIEDIRHENSSGTEMITIITDVFSEEETEEIKEKLDVENRGCRYATLAEEVGAYMDSADIPYKSCNKGESVELSYVIEGFVPSESGASDKYGYNMKRLWFYISPYMYESAAKLCKSAQSLDDIFLTQELYGDCRIRINDKLDFDDAVLDVCEALGLERGKFESYHIAYNSELLSIELKGANALSGLIVDIFIIAVVLVIVWFFVRFIIDNAFEISVSERSGQFAALRIMGASKAQIKALVLTEATFYSITAVPIGSVLAFTLCRLVFGTLRKGGLFVAEFSIKPFFAVLGIGLSIISIYISAFTSAMWASRKLSPNEAMHLSKPVSDKKKAKRRKSRLDRKSGSAVFHYTMCNIFSRKSRFIFVSVSMVTGVMLLTMSILTGLNYMENVKRGLEREFADYTIETYSAQQVEEIVETFSDDSRFKNIRYSLAYTQIPADRSVIETFYKKAGSLCNSDELPVQAIDRKDYEKYIEPLSGVSYDEFAASMNVFVGISPYYDENGKASFDEKTLEFVPCREDSYKTAAQLGFTDAPELSFRSFETPVRLVGAVCCDYVENFNMLFIAMENSLELFKSARSSESMEIMHVFLTVNGAGNAADADKALDSVRSMGGVYVDNNYISSTGLKELIKAIILICAVFVLSIFLAGVFSMVSVINTSVLNRSGELMMIRSIGMTKKQLIGSVILESMVFMEIPSVIGVVLGIVSGTKMFSIMSEYYRDESLMSNTLRQGGSIALTAAVIIAVCLIIAALAALPGINSLKKRMK